jgi:hypothetical protein
MMMMDLFIFLSAKCHNYSFHIIGFIKKYNIIYLHYLHCTKKKTKTHFTYIIRSLESFKTIKVFPAIFNLYKQTPIKTVTMLASIVT